MPTDRSALVMSGQHRRRAGVHAWRSLTVVLALTTALACRGAITNPFGDEGRLTRIEVLGPATLQVGDTVRLAAMGHVAGVVGSFAVDRLTDAVWTVSDPSIVQLTPIQAAPSDSSSFAEAIVRGIAAGTAQVTVSARGISGSHGLRVVAAP